jgi:DNA-binding CsgD family transcriptional regulator
MEKGASTAADDHAHPHLTRLEHTPERHAEPPMLRTARERLVGLSPKQRELLDVLRVSPSVSQAAADLQVSRSNVYASLRRISRKLGTRSVGELLLLVREGDLLI